MDGTAWKWWKTIQTEIQEGRYGEKEIFFVFDLLHLAIQRSHAWHGVRDLFFVSLFSFRVLTAPSGTPFYFRFFFFFKLSSSFFVERKCIMDGWMGICAKKERAREFVDWGE